MGQHGRREIGRRWHAHLQRWAVLSVTGMSDSFQEAANLAYARLSDLALEGAHHRRDIGARAGVQHPELN